jgi:hypothetical protein
MTKGITAETSRKLTLPSLIRAITALSQIPYITGYANVPILPATFSGPTLSQKSKNGTNPSSQPSTPSEMTNKFFLP